MNFQSRAEKMLYAIFLVMMAVATTILLLVLPEESANPISRTVEEEETNLNYIFQIGANFKNRFWKILKKIKFTSFSHQSRFLALMLLTITLQESFLSDRSRSTSPGDKPPFCTDLLFFYLSANFIFLQIEIIKKLIQNLQKRWTGSKWT